ncbi:unnamed protein product [Paramecium octaurelia]|uniref:Uncharacterized protein n=1 Tax=Paramecium octaurelia TaxID=43137 RepID=A0A8S1V2F2_PAROT|nr:unnamed protein product [Paramecium octaurelia]
MTQLKHLLFLKKISELLFKILQTMKPFILGKRLLEISNTKLLLLKLLLLMKLQMLLMMLLTYRTFKFRCFLCLNKDQIDTLHKKLSDNTSYTPLLQPVITALTELATHGFNQKALTKIAQLLSKIRQQISLRESCQDKRQAARWAEFSVHLANEHTRLVERKAQLEVQIQEQKNTIEDVISWIEFHTLEFENTEERLAGQTAQEEVVDRLQEHISGKLSTTAQFIANRN